MNARTSRIWICLAFGGLLAAGCSAANYGPEQTARLRERAIECLRRGVSYEYLATVRAQSIEAVQMACPDTELPRVRLALQDQVPAVRFAAAVALGTLRDRVAEPALRRLLESEVTSDRLAAIFALHRLGDARDTAELAYHLLDNPDVAARCHAALLLGRLGEPGAVALLNRAMRDPNPTLRANVLEALALLGSREAIATLYAQTYGGIGEQETFALMVLGQLRDPAYHDMFAQRLASALHLETRLAAARALGLLGDQSGYETARQALSFVETRDEKNDPAANRTLRVRQMAALALGAIGDPRALGPLDKTMNSDGDPRLLVSAAAAILEIAGNQVAQPLFAPHPSGPAAASGRS